MLIVSFETGLWDLDLKFVKMCYSSVIMASSTCACTCACAQCLSNSVYVHMYVPVPDNKHTQLSVIPSSEKVTLQPWAACTVLPQHEPLAIYIGPVVHLSQTTLCTSYFSYSTLLCCTFHIFTFTHSCFSFRSRLFMGHICR